jgi:hypothetical protein
VAKRASWLHGPAPVFGPAWRYLVIVVGAPHSSALTQEAQSVLGGMKPYTALAAITSFLDALALYVLKKCLLYRSVDVPEAEVVLVDGGGRPPPIESLAGNNGAIRTVKR